MTFDEMVLKECEEAVSVISKGLANGSAGDYTEYRERTAQIKAYRRIADFVRSWRSRREED